MTILIIDADPIVYRSGFAAEKFTYHVIAEDATGKPYERYFSPKDGESSSAQISQWLTQYKLTELSKAKLILPEPVGHALYLVKQELENIKQEVSSKYGKITKQYTLLSGPGNFRCKLAKQRPYKGNRDPSHKPYHYQAIRDYLSSKGAIVVSGREPDDEVSILAYESIRAGKKSVVATIDKDLDQIPGSHFDYRQKVFYEIDESSARRWFWIQCLSGDPTDNIPGCYRVGPKKAEQMIDELLEAGKRDEQIWDFVVYSYEQSTLGAGCVYTKEQAEEVALETARLVYIQKNANELWNPPGVPMGTMKGEIDD